MHCKNTQVLFQLVNSVLSYNNSSVIVTKVHNLTFIYIKKHYKISSNTNIIAYVSRFLR